MSENQSRMTVIVSSLFFIVAFAGIFWPNHWNSKRPMKSSFSNKTKKATQPRLAKKDKKQSSKPLQKKRAQPSKGTRIVFSFVKKYKDNSLLMLGVPLQPSQKSHSSEVPLSQKLVHLQKKKVHFVAPHLHISNYLALDDGRIVLVDAQKKLYMLDFPTQSVPKAFDDKVDFHPFYSKSKDTLFYIKKKSLDTSELVSFSYFNKQKSILHTIASEISSPVLSPDEKEMAFISGKSGIASIWKWHLQDNTETQVTNIGLRAGKGLPASFVPPPVAGKMKWCDQWLVFDTGSFLWTVDSSGSKPQKRIASPLSFSCTPTYGVIEFKTSEKETQKLSLQ